MKTKMRQRDDLSGDGAMSDQDKRCGTCKWWLYLRSGDESDGKRGFCESEGATARTKIVDSTSGTTCPCWEAKEQ